MKSPRKDTLWKSIYVMAFIVVLAIPVAFVALNYVLVPEPKTALFNRDNGLFQDEDLSKTSVSEGVVKQYIVDTFERTFDFTFLELTTPSDYRLLTAGEKEQDLPDHRDVIRPYFSDDAHKHVVSELLDGPWMTNLYRYRGYVLPVTSQPPIRRNANGWETNSQGYLTGRYDGNIVAVVSLPDQKEVRRFKVDYTVTVTRKPLLFDNRPHTYFFQPLVPKNVGEWHISDVTWTVDRVM